MDIDLIMQVVRPVLGVFGLLVFTYALGRLVDRPMRADSSRDAQLRTATMLLFWTFFCVYLLEPREIWVQRVLLLAAAFYLAGVFAAPLRRTLFRQRGSEGDNA